MGVLANFIIATEAEAREYSRTQNGIPSVDLFETKNITAVELSTLLALLNGEEWREDLLDSFPYFGDNCGLTILPDSLFNRLTDFDYDLEQVATDWAETEEMQCNVDDAAQMIDQLSQFALRAREIVKPVFLWNCA